MSVIEFKKREIEDVAAHQTGDELDHFIVRDGKTYAGTHLIIDLYDAERLTDKDHMDAVFRACVEACGATLLHIHIHTFLPSGGLSGVAVLAESHISVHTWPERGYAAFDVFMCGDSEPQKAVAILEAAFNAGSSRVGTHLRGEGVE
ncbi:adenosylmethionine decarboxylase [Parvularcula dongshanensis]|uniref:S-adenosylmethionine decarboxylase proenzyme n=1 Tax=Parvularcula dongshanensis TaxID=1173995 RepID=A0A840HYC6_9PROT|nr:adenosylmethionine decarboxylase [Parvularcula dongshanensis]MBB4657856.1 S-adenosylmethionine decarboxylase [Parvularcula dongshanensis]